MTGDWDHWTEDNEQIIGWLPDRDDEPPTPVARADNPRDAHIAVELMRALDLRPPQQT